MSVDLIVYVKRSAMPTTQRWAEAIREAGFPLELGSDFDLDTATGFRPCKLRGVLSGFEYYSGRLSEQDCQDLGAPSGCDFSAMLSTGSDLRECATSLIAASVLCQISNGMLYDPQAGDQHSATAVMTWAREQLASFENEIAGDTRGRS